MQHPTYIKVILRHIAKQHLEVKEISSMLERSPNHVYRCHDPNDNTDYKAGELVIISRHLSEMGYNDLAECMISAQFHIQAVGDGKCNGSVDDEIAEIVAHLGKIKLDHSVRNKEAVQQSIKQLEALVPRLHAEAGLL